MTKIYDIPADQQTLILLALVNSSLITLRDENQVPEMQPTILYGCDTVERLVITYPVKGRESVLWYQQILNSISGIINQPAAWFDATTVVALGERICADLLGELIDPEKRAMIGEAHEIIRAIDNVTDPDGDAVEVYDEVDSILKDVYRTVGFTIEHRYIKHLRKLERRLKQLNQ